MDVVLGLTSGPRHHELPSEEAQFATKSTSAQFFGTHVCTCVLRLLVKDYSEALQPLESNSSTVLLEVPSTSLSSPTVSDRCT